MIKTFEMTEKKDETGKVGRSPLEGPCILWQGVECDQIGSVEMTPTWRGELKGQASAAIINKNARGFYGNPVTDNED